MKFNLGFSKCSSFINSWKPVIGYETEEIKNDFALDQSDLTVVKDVSIPAGSNWQQYRDYPFICLCNIDVKGKTLYVLSIAHVKQDEKTERFYPETYMDVFDSEGMKYLKKRGAEDLVNYIHKELDKKFIKHKNDITIPGFEKEKFYTYSTNKNYEKKQQEWYYLELFLIENALNKWNLSDKEVSVATLCTMQDDFTKFGHIGILDPQKLSFKGIISSYATIELDEENSGKRLKVKVVSKTQISQKKIVNTLNALWSKRKLSFALVTIAFLLCGFFFFRPLFSKFFFLSIHHFS